MSFENKTEQIGSQMAAQEGEQFKHLSVMLCETVDMLNVREGGVYVDGTLGGGGHSAEILRRLNGTGHLYGIDRDNDALAAATARLGGAAISPRSRETSTTSRRCWQSAALRKSTA